MAIIWVRLMVQTFESANLNICELFERVGLEYSRLNNPHGKFKQDELSLLWQAASLESGNPAIGLLMSNSPVMSVFNELSYGILASDNMCEAMSRLIRYQRFVGEAMDFKVQEEANGYRIIINSAGHTHKLAYEGFDGALAIILVNIRWVSQLEITPLEITCFQPTPDNIQPYEALFRCPIKFNQEQTSLLISHEDYIRPSPIANKAISAKHDDEMTRSLKELDQTNLSRQVMNLVIKQWNQVEPQIEDVASYFNMSKRTFQRRLKEDGWTFLALVDHCRKVMALEYVEQPKYALQHISHLLGFTEHSNFYRAFKRWYGMTPKQYREQLN